MAKRSVVGFIGRYIILGLGVAAAVIWLAPGLVTSDRPVVKVEQAPASDPAGPAPNSYATAVQRAAPAVVNIYTAKSSSEPRHPFFDNPLFERFFEERHPDRPRTETSLGSGVLMSRQGYILTNHHVVQDATAIQVRLTDGRRAGAAVVGTDPETDLAVLRIGLRPLPSVTTGQSSELAVGDVVLAIGNPFGVGQTVTQGIVSATGRSQLGLTTFEDFIQTDAAINPGNSGGALVNARGELIGINTAIYSRSGGSMGIGFAIPVDLARGVMGDIIEDGEVTRGWLGLQVQSVTNELADAFGLSDAQGVLVANVYADGPASEAGLRAGDIIVRVDDSTVEGARQLRQRVTALEPGDRVTLTLRRDGERLERELSVARRPSRGSPPGPGRR
jgi:serine protease DegS